MKQPGVLTGAFVGLIVTAPLMAVLFVVSQLGGLAFAPFELFDWLRDRLPGGVVIGGIELLSKTLTLLGLSVREASKPAEYITVLGLFLVLGILGGLAIFAIIRQTKSSPNLLNGLILGALPGLALGAIVLTQTATGILDALLTLVASLGWGAAIGWTYDRLAVAPAEKQPLAGVLSARQLGRRQFLIRMGAASASITVVGAGLGSFLAARSRPEQAAGEPPTSLPNIDDPLIPAPGTRPEYTPLEDHYRIDISLAPPAVDGSAWTLPVTGLVERELNLTLDDLRNRYPAMDQYITLSCISNSVGGDLISTTRWAGTSVQNVLEDASVMSEARYLALESADGFYEVVDLAIIRDDARVMFTYAWDGVPLPSEHGFPLRIFIPDRYGMKQPKWIVRAELVADYHDGYWVERGWDQEALVKATSVIDTVAVDEVFTSESGDQMVPVGGIAYAGDRSISRVEVKVDDGDWVQAQLRKPISETTWVIWRYDWPFQEGSHTFYVRCQDGTGAPQIERQADTFPSGATGIHSRRI